MAVMTHRKPWRDENFAAVLVWCLCACMAGICACLPQRAAMDPACEAAFNNSQFSKAAACLEVSVRHHPDHADLRVQLGQALLKIGRIGEAVAQFQKAIELEPHNAPMMESIQKSILGEARELQARGQDDMYVRCLTASTTLDPDNVDAYIALAKAFLARGDRLNALACINRAAAIAPRNPEVLQLLDYFSGGFH